MADSGAKDPAALWREMVGQWEKGMNALATQYMGTDEFSRDANRYMTASLKMQKGLQDMMGRYFDAINIPTKPDIDGLGERLRAIEEQLDTLNAAVERLAGPGEGPAGGVPRVPRTKRYVPKTQEPR